MTIKLLISALLKFIFGVISVGLLIFLPAGTIYYFNGWLLMGVLFVPMLFVGIAMMLINPELLRKRIDAKESLQEQKLIVKLIGLMFVVGFVVSGLGVRLGWYVLPRNVSICASGIFIIAYIFYAEVLRENTYLSRTIKVSENHTVIDSRLYSIVRHPMYSSTLFMFMTVPIILGSLYSLIIFIFYPFIIAQRIKSEEKFLEKELTGYHKYMQKVKYRLIPFIW